MQGVELKIVPVGTLLSQNLAIPDYQRPYRWSRESAATLFSDMYEAYMANVPEYRAGTVVLHKKNGKLDIVDGQQRLTTLSILMFCFSKRKKDNRISKVAKLLDVQDAYGELSIEALLDNLDVLEKKCSGLGDSVITSFQEYILSNCTMVEIITESEQEAFQFFDSQNSRGKELSPHDLLKSYHLREMADESEERKVALINQWENTKQSELVHLFEYNLFPLVRWFKYMDGINYSVKDIKTFKGIRKNSTYNFSVYHRASNLYIEEFNGKGMYELLVDKKIPQFQLTQPLIAGSRFFAYTLYYYKLYKKIDKMIGVKYSKEEIPDTHSGDKYVRDLFINILMFFVDRFNFESLTDARRDFLYKWTYSLRLVMKAVYRESVNKYAQGKNERVNKGLNIFMRISEMQSPEELDIISLDEVTYEMFVKSKVNITKYRPVWEHLS